MPKRVMQPRIDILKAEFKRRRSYVENLLPKTKAGKVAPHVRGHYQAQLAKLRKNMHGPLTVEALKIMLGDYPGWFGVRVVRGRITLEDPVPMDNTEVKRQKEKQQCKPKYPKKR